MDEVFIGELAQFPYNFCPSNWAYCHGQLLLINEYEALFSLLGITFGGDGVTNFALPDLRPKDTDGNLLDIRIGDIYEGKVYMETFIALIGIYPSRS